MVPISVAASSNNLVPLGKETLRYTGTDSSSIDLFDLTMTKYELYFDRYASRHCHIILYDGISTSCEMNVLNSRALDRGEYCKATLAETYRKSHQTSCYSDYFRYGVLKVSRAPAGVSRALAITFWTLPSSSHHCYTLSIVLLMSFVGTISESSG